MTVTTAAVLGADDRARLGRRAQLLAGASVGYNLVEAAVAIGAGIVASSVALVGFGLDSIVESFSGAVILWQFRHRLPETRERAALRLIGVSFFALAAYVTIESVRSLTGTGDAETSRVGIVLAALSLVVMPFLSWAQRRTGRALGSGSVVADSKQTLLCTYLSAVLLAGLVLNATLGWSWADPLVALVIAAVAVKEGLEAWRGDACCVPAVRVDPDGASIVAASCGCGDSCSDACCAEQRRRCDTCRPPRNTGRTLAMGHDHAHGTGDGAGHRRRLALVLGHHHDRPARRDRRRRHLRLAGAARRRRARPHRRRRPEPGAGRGRPRPAPRHPAKTWGYRRAEVLAAAAQAAVLLAVGVFVLVEGVQRLIDPPEVASGAMVVFGIVGLLGNLVAIGVLAGAKGANLNMRAAFLEVVNDALGSAAVLVAAASIAWFGWQRADAVASLLIGGLILPRTWRLLRETVDVLLEATPKGLDLDDVRAHILSLPHVREVHDLHASQVATNLPVLSAHVVVDDGCFHDGHAPQILDQLQQCVASHHGVSVEHSTFQLEAAGHGDHEHPTHN